MYTKDPEDKVLTFGTLCVAVSMNGSQDGSQNSVDWRFSVARSGKPRERTADFARNFIVLSTHNIIYHFTFSPRPWIHRSSSVSSKRS